MKRQKFKTVFGISVYDTKVKGQEYAVRVNNHYKGFVSVTNEDGDTGLSETCYYPFFEDEEDGWFAGQMNLAQMINEAWYHCNN